MIESTLNPDGSEDPVQAQLRSLIAQLRAKTEAAPDIYRQFCRLARAHKLDPEEFRSRLVRAGLTYPRASELKTVILSRDHCSAFLKLPGEPGRQSWKKTLEAARSEERQAQTSQTPEQDLAARVAGRLHRTSRTFLALADGLLVLEPRAGDSEALS